VSLVLLAAVPVAVRTFLFARWAWRQGLRRAAVAAVLLALACLSAPAAAMALGIGY